MSEIIKGFEPFYDGNSQVLILGSFPSVKSRESNFYYGNPRNAFWQILASFFGEQTPVTTEEKKSLLTRRRVALWDMAVSCEIRGSADAAMKNITVADLGPLFANSKIGWVLLNGGKAAQLYFKNYSDAPVRALRLPSTSPANAHPKKEAWHDALRQAFNRS